MNSFVSIHPKRDYAIAPMPEHIKNSATPITHTQVLVAIRRSKPLRAPGIGSLRIDHLKAMTSGEEFDAPSQFLKSFSALIHSIESAQVSPCLASFLYQTSGIGIPKSPAGIRPIGMQDVHVNLAMNILLKENGPEIVKTFQDCNFALNGPKGIDKDIIHCNIWRLIYPNQDSVFVDGKSAYQKVRRDVSLESSKTHLPGMAPILHSLHEKSSRIWLQQGDLWPVGVATEEGTTQGCGGGRIQYAFGAKNLYDNLQLTAAGCEEPAYFIAYYSDDGDGSMGATAESACALLAHSVSKRRTGLWSHS